ncbi:uncharacterized protein LOC101847704 [Aplysia californica]|uniref:Glycosyltransferase family 92 protein n=1 Tax=Aplysia californica TaxID=6500 RepID=A0ABM0JER7_APLCA|nr:uncharacterized protein LOC101847704 [Aplysia californica]
MTEPTMHLRPLREKFMHRKERFVLLLMLIGPLLLLYSFCSTAYSDKAGRYTRLPLGLPRSPSRQLATRKLSSMENGDVIVYSAIVIPSRTQRSNMDVIVTTLRTSEQALTCCFVTYKLKLLSIQAQAHFSYYSQTDVHIGGYLNKGGYFALQYKCTVPLTDDYVMYLTMTPQKCPESLDEGIEISYVPEAKNRVALCTTLTDKYEPTPSEMVSWLEIQIQLGVDKIFIYDLLGSKNLSKVFDFYQRRGVLELQRFTLPKHEASEGGANRPLEDMQAESVPVLDCRQRAAGFTYVLCLGLDKALAPMSSVTLNGFFQELLKENPDSAGFYIDVDWSLTNPIEGETSRLRWIADKPYWEATMFMFLPDRVHTPNLSSMQPQLNYSTYKLLPEKAKLRHCPSADWDTCFPEPKIKNRYRTLNHQIRTVLSTLGINR